MRGLLDGDGQLVQVDPDGYPVTAPYRWVDVGAEVTPETHQWDGEAVTPRPGWLDEAREARRRVIERERDQERWQPVAALGRLWDADEASQALLTRALTVALTDGRTPIAWRDAQNQDLVFPTRADLVAIAGAIAEQTEAAFARSWARKAALDAAVTPAELAAV